MSKTKKEEHATAAEALEYSGVAIDKADKDKVDNELVKERTKTLNNNPRNDAE